MPNTYSSNQFLNDKLHKIWKKSFDLDHIGPDDNFFEIGGESIIAAKILLEIEKEIGELLPFSVILKAPTINQLAKLIEKRKASFHLHDTEDEQEIDNKKGKVIKGCHSLATWLYSIFKFRRKHKHTGS